MLRIPTARRSAALVLLAAAIVAGTAGCGQSATQTGAAPTTPSAAAATVTTAPSTSAAAEADVAGVQATAAQEAPVEAATGSVDGPQLAMQVSTELAKAVGQTPESVTCPDLLAKVGTSIRCKLTDGGSSYGVTVVATSVQGADVAFSIKVDDQAS